MVPLILLGLASFLALIWGLEWLDQNRRKHRKRNKGM